MYNLPPEGSLAPLEGECQMGDPSFDRLQTLYDVTVSLSSELDLKALLPRVIDQVIAVTGAERGFLMLGKSKDDLTFHVARGLDKETIDSPEFQVSRGVVERVAESDKSVLTVDAQTEGWLADRKSIHQLNLRSLMCVPLRAKGESIGLVYVDNRMQAGIFTKEDLALLEAVASSAAVAIENARLYGLAVEQARLERELELARGLQTALIPSEPADFPGLMFAGRWSTARQVAGDFYDFIPRRDGSLVVVVGDVTDKGIPAAFFMALARTTVRASVAYDTPLKEAISQANQILCADASGGMFVTLYAISVGPDNWTLNCVCAGHHPPLHVKASSSQIEMLPKGGMPLGIDENQTYSSVPLKLEPGDSVLLYTDGVPDAIDREGEFFGMDRLMDVLQANADKDPQEMLAAVHGAVDDFSAGGPRFDDLTLVGMKRV